ncbi:MAG: YajQ family cyclic di-GMP-binding protein [Verrucomicrobiae bacterium]|nr:YajQ family cyclic di-GMP-binding protein [Verrucomicrobiae bacterium]
MASFDIVSQVNSMEVENAVNQATKELATRFDFKDGSGEIVLAKHEIQLKAADAFKMRQLCELVVGRLAKRGISLKNVDQGEPDLSPLGHARQTLKIKQGIDGAAAKQITQFIRQKGFKVTAAIQGEEIRVTGKSRDELQAVITAVKGGDWPVAVSFVNFRD